jgi:outer membrane protein assembly factor BamB
LIKNKVKISVNRRAASLVFVLLLNIAIMPLVATAAGSNQSKTDSYTTIYPWPMPAHDVGRTAFTNSKPPETNHTLWVFDTAQYAGREQIRSPISVTDGRVFFSTGTVVGTTPLDAVNMLTYCVDQNTGKLLWDYETNNHGYGGSTVAYGRVFVAGWNVTSNPADKWPIPYLYCFDEYRGELLWKNEAQMEGAVIPADGKIYWTNTMNSTLFCTNPMTGQTIWTASGIVSPAYNSGKVFCCAMNGYGYNCYNSSTGTQIWKYDNDVLGHQFVYGTMVADGKAFNGNSPSSYVSGITYQSGYFIIGLGYYYCWDANTGKLNWRYQTTWNVSGVNYAAVGYGKVFVGMSDFRDPTFGSGYLLALDENTGQLLWKFDIGPGGTLYGSPALADNKVYLCTQAGNVYCLDQNSGTILWQYKMAKVSHTPAIADGRFYVGDAEGKLYCFGKGPTKTDISVTDSDTVQGTAVAISGKICDDSPASLGAPISNSQVKLMSQKVDDSSWSDIGNPTTTDLGQYVSLWTPPSAGTFRVMAQFNGTDSYESSNNTILVQVNAAPVPSATQTPISATDIANQVAAMLPTPAPVDEVAEQTIAKLPAFTTAGLVLAVAVVAVGVLVITNIVLQLLKTKKQA